MNFRSQAEKVRESVRMLRHLITTEVSFVLYVSESRLVERAAKRAAANFSEDS